MIPEKTKKQEESTSSSDSEDPEPEEDPLHTLIFSKVKDGNGKQATIESVGKRKDYTSFEAKEAFNSLVEDGKILVSGPSNRPVYTVVEGS